MNHHGNYNSVVLYSVVKSIPGVFNFIQTSMNAILMEGLDHVSKTALTPLDRSFAAVKVAMHCPDITALVCL